MDITTEFANDGIRQADKIIDELNAFMTALEDAGILTGWRKFMESDNVKESQQ